MATLAGHLAVATIEQEIGALAMVEVPQDPGAGVVATIATRAKFLLVLVLFLMAGEAVARSVLETCCEVAAFASRWHVPTDVYKRQAQY